MIVPTMTLEEVAKQYSGDMDNLLAKRYSLQPKFSSLVKKSRRFPVVAQYEYISHTNHNRYFFNYSAQKRGEWNTPHCNVFCVFEKPEGKYAISSVNGGRLFIVFPPHFFSRYRERILKDDSIHGVELIKRYFLANDRMIKEELTEAHTKAYKKYEKEDGSVQAARVAEGNIFLEVQLSSKIILVKTIISDEMLFEDQKAAFGEMKESLDEIKDLKIYIDQIRKK